jgi:hypothetical protein
MIMQSSCTFLCIISITTGQTTLYLSDITPKSNSVAKVVVVKHTRIARRYYLLGCDAVQSGRDYVALHSRK